MKTRVFKVDVCQHVDRRDLLGCFRGLPVGCIALHSKMFFFASLSLFLEFLEHTWVLPSSNAVSENTPLEFCIYPCF